MSPTDPTAVYGLVAFMVMLFGVIVFALRRGRSIELNLQRPVPTESGGPGGAFPTESEWAALDAIGRERDTHPAPAPHATPLLPPAACKACSQPATRATPKVSRGNRYEDAGGLLQGHAVELDHHGDRLYGQPRPEVIVTAAGSDYCATHETMAYRLIERFHARQRAKLNEVTGELALEAAAFEGGGLLREIRQLQRGPVRRGKA